MGRWSSDGPPRVELRLGERCRRLRVLGTHRRGREPCQRSPPHEPDCDLGFRWRRRRGLCRSPLGRVRPITLQRDLAKPICLSEQRLRKLRVSGDSRRWLPIPNVVRQYVGELVLAEHHRQDSDLVPGRRPRILPDGSGPIHQRQSRGVRGSRHEGGEGYGPLQRALEGRLALLRLGRQRHHRPRPRRGRVGDAPSNGLPGGVQRLVLGDGRLGRPAHAAAVSRLLERVLPPEPQRP